MSLPKRLFILSGPSGAGKTTIIQLLRNNPLVHFARTYTTRPMRLNESETGQYYFVSYDEFAAKIASGEIMEHSNIYGYLYGIPSDLFDTIPKDKPCAFVDVDPNAYHFLRERFPNQCVGIFIARSLKQIRKNVVSRIETQNCDKHEIETRISIAYERIRLAPGFDYLVINQEGELEVTSAQINAIITAETLRMPPNIDLMKMLE